ncbi:hypothetical protein SAMN05216598_1235 [Pseudomonas asplenii]|uniref:DUF3077 domain-containing protein n=1 Tax=Pseudomonas asplenii TaxID=53407 RepID=A0A1H1RAF0_9PSED|nr:hypothetical protein [Pseudomonas asplenii]SDS32742.1 hypothetical protein SAMN05216598_1235 [Pseudomonas asplenii]
MKTIVPDPPMQKTSMDAEAAERAFVRYELPAEPISKTPHFEDTLNNLDSILRSAAATAYESAEQLSGMPRHLAMASVHLIELAQSQVDGLLGQQH